MRVIHHSHSIGVSSDQAFNWFTNLDKNYIAWHPDSHINFKWLSGKPVTVGSTFIFEESIRRHKHKMLMEVSDFAENQRLSFSSNKIEINFKYLPCRLMSFLISLFRIKLEMHRLFEAENGQLTTIRLTHKFGSQIPVIDKLVDFVTERFIFSSKSHLAHIEEEAQNMKSHLE